MHGLTEPTNSWGKREETIKKYEKFVSDGLKLDHASINISDIHRLPEC